MSSPAERRTAKRVPARLDVRVEGGAISGDTVSISTINISTGGVYVEIPHFIEPLTKLSIALMIPGPTESEEASLIEVEAIVVRTLPDAPSGDVERYEVACAFLELSDSSRDLINRYVLSHTPPPAS
ncbi:MAG: PilZ domain-containing protein [Gemmatimonadota bacterium]|nr:hypothetical protein [Gemmatimonadota bacterium]MDP6460831.1 PilZ domain-containing protein [Gemmatimonadota bacterium]MDP6528565.1 PilZ domain-containing protein [Gemmatimonadota bacterium]MDP6801914.1 PilZ domain-containing protein [Gemmatimonadota bacterium]